MRHLLALLALTVVGCGGTNLAPGQFGRPGLEVDVDGPFRLTFAIPVNTVRAGDAVIGQAQLELTDGIETTLSGSGGGPLAFEFRELTGDRRMIPAWTADCAAHRLRAGEPITSAIKKSGGWTDEEPHADFYRTFFQGPDVRLPVGDWEITAVAVFGEGPGCGGRSHELRAPVLVRVLE